MLLGCLLSKTFHYVFEAGLVWKLLIEFAAHISRINILFSPLSSFFIVGFQGYLWLNAFIDKELNNLEMTIFSGFQ
ncbi:hypothetical protein BCEN4_740052 [Burkholderia cenocepacia]|nr:hypothetical protein BCEN4_740052 [Burkholderia cenocepacia]